MGDLNMSNQENLEERKLKEIEHSRVRRQILQGYERQADASDQANLEELVRDQDAFSYHFSNMKYYSIIRSSEEYYFGWLRERCTQGKKALDYCCGSGENGVFMAKCGADVIGIDISPEGVENANLNAAREGLAQHAQFEVRDAEATGFPDDFFDVIVIYGALHHLEYRRAMAELRRIIKPDGEIIAVEALKHNPLIHLYRKRTPHLRTEWEVNHILTVNHLDISRQYFREVDARFFHLAALFAVPMRKTKLFKPLLGILEQVDKVILKRPFIGKYAWQMVFTMSGPMK
jgi:ubiquinone/menaquinone biosynthesis C-methylase UbiE